ncbi:MAG: YncE family protein [Bacteroidetes bacterium]|nr:YncE family protein [Bacteroidota bacterium]
MQKKITTVALFIFLSLAAFSQNVKKFHLIKSYPILSNGGWDYIAVGPGNNRLYVSHSKQVNILDENTGDSIGIIENTIGVHGIAFDAAANKGFTSNGRLNTVTVFNLTNNQPIAQIKTGTNPDAIMYEPYSKKIITCNGRSKNLTIIDPELNKAVDSIDVGGKPETAVSDGKGKIFVNIEDKNEIVAIDVKSFKVISHWSIAPGDGPTGLAIDVNTNRLFAGCDKLLMIVDANSGKIVDKLPIGDGCDGVAFDPALKNIYTANGEGTITVVNEKDENNFSVTDNIISKKSARTIALDPATHQLFLPASELEPLAPGQTGRAKLKPGTFQVLVVGP